MITNHLELYFTIRHIYYYKTLFLQSKLHSIQLWAGLWADVINLSTNQAVELGDGRFVARLTNVPDLDAPLATGVHVSTGFADCDGAHNLAVVQSIDLPGVSGNSGTE